MNIQTIAEHLVDMDSLKPKSWILDIGCFGFTFYKHMKSLGHNVVGVDIQVLNEYPYNRVAISDRDGLAYIEYSEDKQATRISKKETPFPIRCTRLDTFSKSYCIDMWDMIKCDCEGSEYEIIMSLEKAPAKMFEIEFHLHTGVYSEEKVTQMVDKLCSIGYNIISHEKTFQHGLSANYWSSLFMITPYV